MTRIAPLLVVAIATAALARSASADVGVVVTGEATLQPQLAAQLEGWLRDRGHVVRPSPLEPDAINRLIDCFVMENLSCAVRIVEQRARTQAIVYARVEMTANQSDGSRDVAITGYWLAKGHETLSERRACKHCTDRSIRSTADDLMIALAAEPPTNSHVIVGEVGSGGAPKPAATAPAPMPRDEAAPSRALPIALIAAGGVLVVGGGVIALTAKNEPSNTTQEYYKDYRGLGAIPGVIGLGLAAFGVYELVHAGSPASHPTAAVTPSGATFGWAGSF